MSAAHIIIVDDEPDIRSLLADILRDEGYHVDEAENAESAQRLLQVKNPNLVLLDIWMPDADGISLLKEWKSNPKFTAQVVMISGHGSVETAIEATRLGAFGYLEKPLSTPKLLATIQQALETGKSQAFKISSNQLANLPVGKSQLMTELRDQLDQIADHDNTLLLTGEQGTEKISFAYYLHQKSARRSLPFVELDVTGLTAQELHLQLVQPQGILDQADRGTLYIHDVSELDNEGQAILTRAMKGELKSELNSSLKARVISGSQQDLRKLASENRFRDDLYYLIAVVPINIPPLRTHVEDIPELVNHFVDQLTVEKQLPYKHISIAAQNRLRNYSWPGNISELRNVIEQLFLLSSSEEIGAEEVSNILLSLNQEQQGLEIDFNLPLREAREQFEKLYFEHLLRAHNGSIVKVARQAGIERTHLYRKLRSLGIDPKQH